jgi:Transcription factor WhiB
MARRNGTDDIPRSESRSMRSRGSPASHRSSPEQARGRRGVRAVGPRPMHSREPCHHPPARAVDGLRRWLDHGRVADRARARRRLSIRRPALRLHAACAGVDPEVFLPTRGEPFGEALSYCCRCEVRAACLEAAFDLGQQAVGVWDGTSARERRDARRRGWDARRLLAEPG